MNDVNELVPVTALIPKHLMDSLKKVADQNARSVSGEVRLAIRAHVEPHRKQAA